MQINDYLDSALDAARETKKHACRECPADIHPFIGAYRANELVALITMQHHVRDEILEVARVCAIGFDSDVVSMTVETYMATREDNPHTEKPWAPGEMQEVAQHQGGVEKGWVSEALMVAVANRTGDVAARNQQFHYSTTNHLIWDGTGSLEEVSGPIPDVLRRAMLTTKAANQKAPHAWTALDRTDRDILVTKTLTRRFECAPLLMANQDGPGWSPDAEATTGGPSTWTIVKEAARYVVRDTSDGGA